MTRSRVALVAVLALAALAVPNTGRAADAGAAFVCPAGCVVDVDVPADGVVVPTTTVRLVLPAGYGLEQERYPVVFLLHGAGGSYENWVDLTDVEEFVTAADLDVIVVMPDGGGRDSESGWYSDWVDGSREWETFHIDRVVPWVDAHLETLAGREHRAVMGLSMGGFGALSYAGRHPDVFGAAASFSGALDTQAAWPLTPIVFALAQPFFGTPDSRVWGDPIFDADEWAAHNPTALARAGGYAHLAGRLWVATGTGTPGGPAGDDLTNPDAYLIEHFAWQENLSFILALTLAGNPYQNVSYLGGLHDWPHWEYALHQVLPAVVDAID